jgi:hypothetical protein
LDSETGLYLHLGGELGQRPDFLASAIPVPDDAAKAQELAHRFAQELLTQYGDYRFESEVDRVVALSARLGILVRKDLDIAPAYLLVGPERGTGKTTLAAIDHVIATGHDIAVARLEEDEEKAKQTLFAAFVSSPAAVLFDNLPADSSFSSTVLAAALTKGYVEARLFHTQHTGRATTNLSIYFTGNAVILDEDLQARTLEVRFSPERPKRWTHPDWLAHARATREETRTKLQYLQRAHAIHGRATRGVYVRFEAWGRRVRDPLIWAGLPDVGKRLQDLEDNNLIAPSMPRSSPLCPSGLARGASPRESWRPRWAPATATASRTMPRCGRCSRSAGRRPSGSRAPRSSPGTFASICGGGSPSKASGCGWWTTWRRVTAGGALRSRLSTRRRSPRLGRASSPTWQLVWPRSANFSHTIAGDLRIWGV